MRVSAVHHEIVDGEIVHRDILAAGKRPARVFNEVDFIHRLIAESGLNVAPF